MNATCISMPMGHAMGGQMARRGRDAEMRHSKVIEKRMMVKEKEIITNAYECTKFQRVALWLALVVSYQPVAPQS